MSTEISPNKEPENWQSAYFESQQTIETLQKQLEQYKQAYNQLHHLVQELRRNRFGTKSERVADAENPQMNLFEDDEAIENKPPEKEDETTDVPAHTRRKKNKKDTSKFSREIEVIEVPAEDKVCPCGCQKKTIRYDVKELFHYKPAELWVLEQRREVVACSKGCEKSIQTAPAPKHVLPKAKATESLLAHTIVSKLHHRQPLYHLEKYTELAGISRSTMARWHIQLAEALQPLYNLMKDEIIDTDIASIDATTLQVLKEPGRAAETKSYVYCIRGGPPEKSVVLYAYNAEKHKIFVDEWLEGFQGSIHMDADPFFELLLKDDHVYAANCNAHARRKFEAIAKQVKNKKGLAYEAVGFYNALYKIERYAKQKKLSPEQRFRLRLEKSKPLLDRFKLWLDQNYSTTLPESPLGKAFYYCLRHWKGLCHFLCDGRLEIDNNLTEQQIKPIVIARKNFMFANSVKGAEAICMHFSFIRTALVNNLDPYKYIHAVFKQLPHCQTVEDYMMLLPWNIQL